MRISEEDSLNAILKGRKFKKMMDICFDGLRKEYGLKQSEVEILLFLDICPDARASDMIKALDLNKGLVSQNLNRLSEKQILLVRPDPEDGRAACFRLLPKAEEILDCCRKKSDELHSCLLEGLSDEELLMLTKAAEKIEDNMLRFCSRKEL